MATSLLLSVLVIYQGRVPGKYIKANSSSGYENKNKARFERFFDRLQRYEQQIIALKV
jgi:hypothetical protein